MSSDKRSRRSELKKGGRDFRLPDNRGQRLRRQKAETQEPLRRIAMSEDTFPYGGETPSEGDDMSTDDYRKALLELYRKQGTSLEKIERHFSMDGDETPRRISLFIAKFMGVISLTGAMLGGGWELFAFLYENHKLAMLSKQHIVTAEQIYYEENNPEVALSLVEKAEEMDHTIEVRFLSAYIKGMGTVKRLINLDRPYNKEELDEAHLAMAEARLLKEVDPSRVEPYIMMGQIHSVLGDHEKAAHSLAEALKLEPKNSFLHVRLGLAHYNQNHMDEARQEIETAIKLDPKDKWAWLWKGVLLGETEKKWEEARKAYEKALEIDPRFDLALYNKAWSYLKVKPHQYEEARTAFQAALKINPEYKEAYYGMGMVYGYQDRYEISKLYLDRAISIDDQYLTAFKWRGIVNTEVSDHEAALEDFNQALELDPTNGSLFMRRGRIHTDMGNLSLAIRDLLFAAESSPKNYKVWYYLGQVYQKAGDAQKAIETLDRCLAIQPTYSGALMAKAQVLASDGRDTEAEEAFNLCVKTITYKPERALMARGNYLLSKAKTEAAVKDFREARKASPNKPEPWLLEARALVSLKRVTEAQAAFHSYLALKPDDRDVRKELKALGSSTQPKQP